VNQQDSEIIAGILEEIGFSQTTDPKSADVVILNTCIVKKPTEDRMIDRIRKLSRLGKKLIVAGCMAEALPEKIRKLAPNASILSPHHYDKLPLLIENLINGSNFEARGLRYLDKSKLPRKIRKTLYAPVTISQGCLGSCTFCITKIARGHLRSYPIQSVLNEIKRLIKAGVKEIRLTGQDTGSYGLDLGLNLSDLLQEINNIEGDFIVRLGMANPDTILPIIDNVIDIFKNSDKFYKYFHLPVQSGSDKILKIMRRKYTVDEFIDLIKYIRKKLGEETTIATDIIVAFPGENSEDFQATLELLEHLKPDIVNISRYGDRPKTLASRMYPKIHSGIAKKRSIEVTRLVRKISLEKNRKYIGKIIPVITLEKDGVLGDKCRLLGRTKNYKLVSLTTDEYNVMGTWVKAKIETTTWKVLYGSYKI